MGLSLTPVSDGDRHKGPLQRKWPFGGSSCKPCKCLQEDIVTRSFSAQQTENRVKKIFTTQPENTIINKKSQTKTNSLFAI